MIAEFGFLSLLIAVLCALLLCVLPPIGLVCRRPLLYQQARPLAYGVGAFSLLSVGVLAYAFATDDFSLEYVAAHSNSQLPTLFKIAALWGGHEGSMLFWLLAVALWTAALAFFSRNADHAVFASRSSSANSHFFEPALSVLGLINLCFAAFILFFSNPFGRLFPAPLEGRDLNPMLQDVGLIFHPPLLYIGYVGFAVNFALSIAALLQRRPTAQIAGLMRCWVQVSWLFLTLGMVLGAWWAYYELGWGGWWFWDPVENASLMPWLLGLALLHSLRIAEKRGLMGYWVTLLSLLAFTFSVLGTFIVRSGALTSVHAFSIDTQRGGVLLIIFALLSIGSLALFALRSDSIQPPSAVKFSLISKTGGILLLNIMAATAVFAVFLGTFYPMFFQAMGWGSISVGMPYFNRIFLPLIGLMIPVMILAPSFKQGKFARNAPQLVRHGLWLAVALLLAYGMISHVRTQDPQLPFHLTAYVLLSLAIWLLLATLAAFIAKPLFSTLGATVAHSGVAIAMIGAVMSGYFGSEIGVRLNPSQSQSLGQFRFHYQQFSNDIGANFTAETAHFQVFKQEQPYAELRPQRRYYDAREMTMSEVGLAGGLWGDLYIVMGDPLGNGEFSFRLHNKPLIRWLWAGGVLMALGALLAACQTAYQPKRKSHE